MHVEEALFRSYLQNGNGLIELAFNGKLAHILPHRSESPRATTYPKSSSRSSGPVILTFSYLLVAVSLCVLLGWRQDAVQL